MSNPAINSRTKSIRISLRLMWGLLVTLWLLPWVAMNLTDAVQWGVLDFLVAGLLLGGLGTAGHYILTSRQGAIFRLALTGLAISIFMLIWLNLAVGLIGPSYPSANLMYFGHALVVLCGGLVGRLQPAAMMKTAYLLCLLQVFILVAAATVLVADAPSIIANLIFLIIWLIIALLFRQSVRQP